MFNVDIQKVKEIVSRLEEFNKIVIIGHTSPDGDAVSSVLSLYLALKKISSAEIYPVVPDDPPNYVLWFPHIKDLIRDGRTPDLISSADLIFCMDFNEPKRVNHLSQYLVKSQAVKVLIDHHPQPDCPAQYIFSYPEASSTAEIVYFFIKAMGEELLDRDIATYLFSGILTDTGVFIHDSADYQTMQVASDLIKLGVDKGEVIKKLYNNYSADRMRLMGYLLHKKMRIFPQYQASIISLTKREKKKFNFRFGDHENIVNMPLSIKEVELSVFLMEVNGKVKVSLRSKGKYNVNLIARDFFAGGGHKNAAGGSFEKSINKARKFLVSKVFPNLKNYVS